MISLANNDYHADGAVEIERMSGIR